MIKQRLTLGSAMPDGTGVCVINLDHRADRWAAFAENILPELAPLPVHRIPAVQGVSLPGYGTPPWFRGRKRDRTWAARGGCTLSHRAALRFALAQHWSYALILEDDLQLNFDVEDTLFSALRNAITTEPFDLCYLGFTDPVEPFRWLCDIDSHYSLHRIFGASTTHAYLINASAIPRILEQLPDESDIWKWLAHHRAIDRFYSRYCSPTLKVNAVSPCLIGQQAGISDITGRPMDSHEQVHVTRINRCEMGVGQYQPELQKKATRVKWQCRFTWIRRIWKLLNGF